MIVNKLASRMLIQTRIMMKFSGGHHHHVYDWRDDHAQNPDFYEDPRMVGLREATEYVTPYKEDKPLTWDYSHPASYNQKNLQTTFAGYTNFGVVQNYPDPPQTDYIADAAHEFDYESEDLDYQAESFESQHFRKQGATWMWVIACAAPLWFFACDFFLQYWPEAENWRYQRPPAYNFPDDQDTNDDVYLRNFKSAPFRELHDAGVVNAPFFEIVDGIKVYSKWAGVNQPRLPI